MRFLVDMNLATDVAVGLRAQDAPHPQALGERPGGEGRRLGGHGGAPMVARVGGVEAGARNGGAGRWAGGAPMVARIAAKLRVFDC
jgi:hypothetical protein